MLQSIADWFFGVLPDGDANTVSALAAALQAGAALISLAVTLSLLKLTRASVVTAKKIADYQADQVRPRLTAWLDYSAYSVGSVLLHVANTGTQPAYTCEIYATIDKAHRLYTAGAIRQGESSTFRLPDEDASHPTSATLRAAAGQVVDVVLSYSDGGRRNFTEYAEFKLADFVKERSADAKVDAQRSNEERIVEALRDISSDLRQLRRP